MPASIVVAGSQRVVATEVRTATGPLDRARGLLGRPPLAEGQALVLEPARSIHTFGMTYPIDVVFCDRDWVVVHVVPNLAPFRVTRWVRRARRAIELPVGSGDVPVGERLIVTDP